MCGISGVFLRDREHPTREQLQRMARAMAHRGPDAEGVFARGPVGLAHRRLKIIDLSDAANQPFFSEAGDLAVVYNGEIYNFRELRAELSREGRKFRTSSDTEVIVQAFHAWGEGSFRRFNGMFAFALWDGRGPSPVLHLVRDRFGIKPLFFAEDGGRLAFASELKPLLTLPWLPREVDRETLFYFLKFSHVPGERSIFRSVRQLPPGTALRFEGGQSISTRYWDPLEVSTRARESWDETEALLELDKALKRAVRRQRVSDVPVGCFLSGGIDSSLLVMACASMGGPPIQTFAIGYKEREFDESAHAREVARHFGTVHRELQVSPGDLVDLIPSIPDHFDQPFADPTLLSSLLLSRLAREHVTVALSGDGGDELFFGYPHQRALLHLRGLASVPGPLRRAAFEGGRRALSWIEPKAGKLAEMLQFSNEAELVQYFVGTIGPMRLDRLANLVKDKPDLSRPLFQDHLDRSHGLPWSEQMIQVFLRTFLVDTVLAKTDRAGMAYGLEARVPFLDDEIVGLAARLPQSFKYRNGTMKYLLRKLLARNLPGRLSRRPKQGFSIPLRDWLRCELKYLLDEYLGERRLAREGYFQAAAVREVVDAHLSGRANQAHLLWSLISFQLWKERYLP